MHPRQTRSRPLVLLRYPGYKLFINNINSPGLFRLSSFYTSNSPLWTDAVTCCCKKQNCSETVNGVELKPFLVEFWLEHEAQIGSVVAIEVYAPMCWSTRFFLDVLSKDLEKHRIISLVNTYFINGHEYPCNTINTMHYKFGSSS